MSDVKSKKELKEYILQELYYFMKSDFDVGQDVLNYLKRLIGQRKHRMFFYKILRHKRRYLSQDEKQRIDNLIFWMNVVYKDV